MAVKKPLVEGAENPPGSGNHEIDKLQPSDVLDIDQQREFTKSQNFDATALSIEVDGTADWDVSVNQVCTITLDQNVTINNPTNMRDGGTYILRVKQDATGSRTITWGAAYKHPGGEAPTLTADANALDIITFVSDGTSMFGVASLNFS